MEGKSEGTARVLCTVKTNGVITAEPGNLSYAYLVGWSSRVCVIRSRYYTLIMQLCKLSDGESERRLHDDCCI